MALAIRCKATESVAPLLRPGLDVAWLKTCGVAVGEWLVMHAMSIVLQVVVERRVERQRLREEEEEEGSSSDEELRPHERNAA